MVAVASIIIAVVCGPFLWNTVAYLKLALHESTDQQQKFLLIKRWDFLPGPDWIEVVHDMKTGTTIVHDIGPFSGGHRSMLEPMRELARLGRQGGKFLEAESMTNLAGLYVDMGRLQEAEALFLKSLEAKRRVFGICSQRQG